MLNFNYLLATTGEKAVDGFKPLVARTRRPGMDGSLGGFGGICELSKLGYKDPVLVSGTDGVGTKLKIASFLDQHDTVGIDLVAMCVNDIVVHGAEPLFFLDYFGSSKLKVEHVVQVVKGISEGCVQAGCTLLGGETAELPGVFRPMEYDIAGFAVGCVERDEIFPRVDLMAEGDVVIGIASSGIHSNGYSLVRKIMSQSDRSFNSPCPFDTKMTLGEALLAPTKIYVKSVLPLIRKKLIKGAAHITGGGLLNNIPRCLPANLHARLDAAKWELPPIFDFLAKEARLGWEEMATTFNCGIGMALICSAEKAEIVLAELRNLGEKAYLIGDLGCMGERDASKQVTIDNPWDTHLSLSPKRMRHAWGNSPSCSPHTDRMKKGVARADSLTYLDAGVDVHAGAAAIEAFRPLLESTLRPGCSSEGSSGGLCDLKAAGFADPVLVSAADGVGTKLKIAKHVDRHDTIGIDLVAMCVNDLAVRGAEPLFFLNYFAVNTLEVQQVLEVVKGISEGCKMANCTLLSSETAELPGMFNCGEYGISGFAVGAVERANLQPSLDDVNSGDVIIGLESSGMHSNGFSLVRRVVKQAGLSYDRPAPFDPTRSLAEVLLSPTRIYVKALHKLMAMGFIKAAGHVTQGGLIGGLEKIVPAHLQAELSTEYWTLPPIFRWIGAQARLPWKDLASTFNCGLGIVYVFCY